MKFVLFMIVLHSTVSPSQTGKVYEVGHFVSMKVCNTVASILTAADTKDYRYECREEK